MVHWSPMTQSGNHVIRSTGVLSTTPRFWGNFTPMIAYFLFSFAYLGVEIL